VVGCGGGGGGGGGGPGRGNRISNGRIYSVFDLLNRPRFVGQKP